MKGSSSFKCLNLCKKLPAKRSVLNLRKDGTECPKHLVKVHHPNWETGSTKMKGQCLELQGSAPECLLRFGQLNNNNGSMNMWYNPITYSYEYVIRPVKCIRIMDIGSKITVVRPDVLTMLWNRGSKTEPATWSQMETETGEHAPVQK